MEIRCAVPEEGLNFKMNWEESVFPSIGDALYLTHFLNEADLLSLRECKRQREETLFDILNDNLLHVKDRTWLRSHQDGKTRCLLILEY
ncbi:hypothetical protein O1363_21410 [Bacteroides fragilis]|uniref:hypothetical protein n=1 Tax=Bacteroides fragilis TaxID=817 RepID=UPI0022AA069F|nr:hypothetical protein [Bacteroides fragilis]MCZ2660832.1 hypothetical protein [Bacteroides fragilis]